MIKQLSSAARGGFLRHLARALPVLLGALLITEFAENAGWLDALNSSALDSVILGKARRIIDDVVIVEITDEDYRSMFEGRSPLKRTQLHRLLGAIRSGNPRLIVVDVDTSDNWQYKDWLAEAPAPCNPVIVWAQGARIVGDGRGRQPAVQPVPFADDRHTARPCVTGLAVFPQDRDGVVRHYLRTIPIAGTAENSLPWAAVKTVRGQPITDAGGEKKKKDDEKLVLNFAGDRYAFPRYASSAVLEQVSAGPAWSDRGPLTGRIVILGGTFSAARDEYRTPLGTMSGVDVVAQAIASEQHGGGIRKINDWRERVVELTVAVLIVYLGYLGHKRAALLADVIGIPVLALAGSWFAFSTLGRWHNFAPYWVSMAIQQALTPLSGESNAHSEPAKSVPAAVAVIAPSPATTGHDTQDAGAATKAGSGQQQP
jgi:CHASE2 domain-containing sensor protein